MIAGVAQVHRGVATGEGMTTAGVVQVLLKVPTDDSDEEMTTAGAMRILLKVTGEEVTDEETTTTGVMHVHLVLPRRVQTPSEPRVKV